MRLTINLDDDLYAMARSHAIATKTSISKAVGDLLRRGSNAAPAARSDNRSGVHPLSGFPICESNGRTITCEDVRRMEEDEDIRQMELMGLSPEQIQRALDR